MLNIDIDTQPTKVKLTFHAATNLPNEFATVVSGGSCFSCMASFLCLGFSCILWGGRSCQLHCSQLFHPTQIQLFTALAVLQDGITPCTQVATPAGGNVAGLTATCTAGSYGSAGACYAW